MKICISTCCLWSSFGSVLQSLGLKKTLKKLGCDSYIVTCIKQKIKKPSINSVKVKSIISYFLDVCIFPKRKKSFKKCNDFIKDNIDILYFDSIYDISCQNIEADAFLSGSDQVWHPQSCNPVFFLEFVDDNKKKLSYAASMGDTNIPNEKLCFFEKNIKRYDFVSVREKECSDVLKELTNKPISINIDPTFLCSSNEWRKYEKPYPLKGKFKKYILLFAIYWDEKFNCQLKELHKCTGLPVIAICSHFYNYYADKRIFDVGVDEFLWLVDNAEYIVTSSFHGVSFSIIFNKKFSAVVNPKTPSRINNLMDTLSVPKVEINNLNITEEFNYFNINKKIIDEQEKSFLFLKRALLE